MQERIKQEWQFLKTAYSQSYILLLLMYDVSYNSIILLNIHCLNILATDEKKKIVHVKSDVERNGGGGEKREKITSSW